MILMIDNYDSFTYNIVHYLIDAGAEVQVVRNDQHSLVELIALDPERLVISPGPCTPNESGISLAAISHFAGRIPVLGICLGHQAIAQVFGGRVVRAKSVMHGKNSMIRHRAQGVFHGLHDPLDVTRYHSLVVEADTLPDELEVTAWTQTGDDRVEEIMGIRHRTLDVQGVQFHPESIMSQMGHQLIANFVCPPPVSY